MNFAAATAYKMPKSLSIAALFHVARGHSSMVIPQGQCPVQGMEKHLLFNLVPKDA